MVARVTLADVDAVRWSMRSAVELFRESVLPALREQDGFEGAYVLTTGEGKALVLTFWVDDASAKSGIESGRYAENVEKFATIYKAPPGRETYDVALAETPFVALV